MPLLEPLGSGMGGLEAKWEKQKRCKRGREQVGLPLCRGVYHVWLVFAAVGPATHPVTSSEYVLSRLVLPSIDSAYADAKQNIVPRDLILQSLASADCARAASRFGFSPTCDPPNSATAAQSM